MCRPPGRENPLWAAKVRAFGDHFARRGEAFVLLPTVRRRCAGVSRKRSILKRGHVRTSSKLRSLIKTLSRLPLLMIGGADEF